MTHKVVTKILDILKEHKYWFEYLEHKPVIISRDAALVRPNYSLQQGAKALIVRITKRSNEKCFVMLVVAGDTKFNSRKIRTELSIKDIRFARENEVSEITQGIQIGGIPPFGNLFDLPVYVDTGVLENEKIIFSAGDRRVSIAMYFKDYQALVKPIVVDMA